jgi:isochorismate pyruvate lyase
MPDSLKIPPADCIDMKDVRGQIDRLDRVLVGLLFERQGYIERAAEIKQDRNVVHDDARIEDVVAKVLVEAKRVGLSAAIAEPVWRTLIARCIAHEFEKFDAKGQRAR